MAGLGGFDLGFGSNLSKRKKILLVEMCMCVLKHLTSIPFTQLFFCSTLKDRLK